MNSYCLQLDYIKKEDENLLFPFLLCAKYK